jgi:hypothetical protein
MTSGIGDPWQSRLACAGFIRLWADESAALERAGRAPLGLMRTALGELEAAF